MTDSVLRHIHWNDAVARKVYGLDRMRPTIPESATPRQDTIGEGEGDKSLPPLEWHVLFGVPVARVSVHKAVQRIVSWSGAVPARTVIATNLDHIMALRADAPFKRAYRRAGLITAGSRAFVRLSKEQRKPLPERIAATDLVQPLMAGAAIAGRSVFFFGSHLDVLHDAARQLKRMFPKLDVRGVYAPPPGFERDPDGSDEVLTLLRIARPDIVLVALPTPHQEIWSDGMADKVRHGVFVNVGDALDRLVGVETIKKPESVEAAGLGWLWSAVGHSARHAPRTTRRLMALPGLYAHHYDDRLTREEMAAIEASETGSLPYWQRTGDTQGMSDKGSTPTRTRRIRGRTPQPVSSITRGRAGRALKPYSEAHGTDEDTTGTVAGVVPVDDGATPMWERPLGGSDESHGSRHRTVASFKGRRELLTSKPAARLSIVGKDDVPVDLFTVVPMDWTRSPSTAGEGKAGALKGRDVLGKIPLKRRQSRVSRKPRAPRLMIDLE
ncbi:MAG: WecB/TagA/CpsF family glycosyltransferase [Devosia sp.]